MKAGKREEARKEGKWAQKGQRTAGGQQPEESCTEYQKGKIPERNGQEASEDRPEERPGAAGTGNGKEEYHRWDYFFGQSSNWGPTVMPGAHPRQRLKPTKLALGNSALCLPCQLVWTFPDLEWDNRY